MKRYLIASLFILFATSSNADEKGECGSGLTYVYEESTKTLTISKTGEGSGQMNDYYITNTKSASIAPWLSIKGGIQTLIVELGVTSIGEYAFYFSDISVVSLPESLVSIGYGAFMDCRKITSLTLPNSLTFVDGYAFSGCEALTSMEIPESVTFIGKGLFSTCFNLQLVKLPSAIKSIEDHTFYACHNLLTVAIPNNVTTIKSYAFQDCGNLKSINIPSEITSIGQNAFEGCSGLERVNILDIGSWCKIDFEDYGNPLYYAKHLFVNDEEINNLVIPDEITEIKRRAFNGFDAMKTLTLGSNIKSIEEYAFAFCNSLEKLVIPSSVVGIGKYAFTECSDLSEVELLGSMETIEFSTFENCSSLKSIRIPEGVKEIKTYAFTGCKNLKEVYLPSSVRTIYSCAFERCKNLKDVYCYATTPPIQELWTKKDVYEMFLNSNTENSTLHVPEGSIDLYREAFPWMYFGTIVALTDNETSIETTRDDNKSYSYYTLDGKKARTPNKGIYIFKQNDRKTKKVIIR
jgi:hypothetical protein